MLRARGNDTETFWGIASMVRCLHVVMRKKDEVYVRQVMKIHCRIRPPRPNDHLDRDVRDLLHVGNWAAEYSARGVARCQS